MSVFIICNDLVNESIFLVIDRGKEKLNYKLFLKV